MVKWIETGDKVYPRVPMKLTMLKFYAVADELNINPDELLLEIGSSASINFKLIKILWGAISYGQEATKSKVFKSDEDFTDWAWMSMNNVTEDDIEGMTEDEKLEFFQKLPIMKIVQSVIDQLDSYYSKLKKRSEKNVEASQQMTENIIMTPDHS